MSTDLMLNLEPCKHHNMTVTGDSQKQSMVLNSSLADQLELAKTEIGEDDKIREESIAQLREWIEKNGDIQNCLTDDKFLLRFLRTKKYSLFMSQQMILKYLNMRKHFDHYMGMMDFREPRINELISAGFLFVSPFRDANGRRVIIYNIGKFDLEKFNNLDMGHAYAITWEALFDDEDTQLLGVTHVANLSGVSAAFTTLFGVREFARIISWAEQSLPLRHKEIHLLNFPSALKFIYDFAITRMSKKLVERFTVDESISDLTKKVDKNCLPLELGGVMPMAEMINLWKQELGEKRERLMSMTNMNLLSDRGILLRKNIKEHTSADGLIGSFRKLEVD